MDRMIYLPQLKGFESIVAQQLHRPMWLPLEAVKYQAYWENANFHDRKWLGRFIEHL